MAFRDVADAAAERLIARLGDGTATYLHASGQSADVAVVFDEGIDVPDPSGQYLERTRVVSVRKAVLLADAAPGDQVTLQGYGYVVQRVLGDDGIVVRLAVA